MFRSKLGALIFMGFILLAVFRVVGTESNGGDIANASKQFGTAPESVATGQTAPEPAPQQVQSSAIYESKDLQADGWGDEVLPTPVH